MNERKKRSKPFPRKKGSFKDVKESKDDMKGTSRINDPEWYVKEPQLAKDVGSLSFNNALGAVYKINVDSPGTDFQANALDISNSVPGIMAIHTCPAVNPANGPYSALNLATKDLYKRVRKMNAGSTNYDSPDLMLYVLAMDSIYSAIFFLQRIYGCATVYSQVNRYVGDAFIAAQGVNPALVRNNLADYRARLNMLITKVSAFATPKDINLFKRHAWMYQGMYMDEPVKKSQVYMYVPAFIWKYVEDSGGPGYLKPQYLCDTWTTTTSNPIHIVPRGMNNLMTVDQLFMYIEECLQAVIESQDMNIMSGDILKAFGDEGIWKLTLIDESYATVPVFSDEVLDQIHNTTFVGTYPSTSVTLSQDPIYSDESLRLIQVVSSAGNYLWYGPKFIGSEHLSYEHVIDMCDDNPTPERVIVATRNTVHTNSAKFTGEGQTAILSNVITCGSDMALCGVFYTLQNNDLTSEQFGYLSRATVDAVKYSRFHKAPILYKTNASGQLQSVTGELGNFTIINSDDLTKLHETALLSLLGVSV